MLNANQFNKEVKSEEKPKQKRAWHWWYLVVILILMIPASYIVYTYIYFAVTPQ